MHPVGGVIPIDDEDGAIARFHPFTGEDIGEMRSVNRASSLGFIAVAALDAGPGKPRAAR